MTDNASIYGNFKLSLQSVVCHRGNSVDSGHYISLVRLGTPTSSSYQRTAEDSDHWMRFDDLAAERVNLIDINQALRDETPYLLFYQILPIDGDPGHITDGEKASVVMSDAADSGVEMLSSGLSLKEAEKDGISEQSLLPSRPSIDLPRGRSPAADPETRRASITFSELEAALDQSSRGPSRRGSKIEKMSEAWPRSQSQTGDRFSGAFSKLTKRMSREKVLHESSTAVAAQESTPEIAVVEILDSSRPPPATVPEAKGKAPAIIVKKDHKREKSKSRIRERLSSSDGKPERECNVM